MDQTKIVPADLDSPRRTFLYVVLDLLQPLRFVGKLVFRVFLMRVQPQVYWCETSNLSRFSNSPWSSSTPSFGVVRESIALVIYTLPSPLSPLLHKFSAGDERTIQATQRACLPPNPLDIAPSFLPLPWSFLYCTQAPHNLIRTHPYLLVLNSCINFKLNM